MMRRAKPLTDIKIRSLKPKAKPFKVSDGDGLYLLVTPTSKLWRLKFSYAGREKLLAFGAYPEVSLADARDARHEARKQLAKGVDPGEVKKAEAAERLRAAMPAETFKAVAEEFFDQHCKAVRSNPPRPISAATKVRDRRILDKLIARLGALPLTEIATPDILATLRAIESTGAHETAHRALGMVTRIYEYAIACGKVTRDASSGLGKALTPVAEKRRAAITDRKQFGALLRSIDTYVGQPSTVAALKLLPLLFTRPGELRLARWGEFDLDGDEPQWLIPGTRTKMRRDHLVPLAAQAVTILQELQKLTDHGADSLVFPSLRPQRPLSENTLNAALRNLDIDGDTHVAHGFRSSASTMLHELGFDPQIIEAQLAHVRAGVAGVYNRAIYLAERRKLMAAWANSIDSMKADTRGKVRNIRS